MLHNLEAISHIFTFESDFRKLRAKSAASVYLCLSHLTLFHHCIFSYVIYFTPTPPLSQRSFVTPRCCWADYKHTSHQTAPSTNA